MLSDRDDHNLNRSDCRRQNQAVVVAVGHDDAADQTGGNTPRSLVRGLRFVLTVLELDFKGFGKVVAEVVGGTCLQALAVVHHRFDGVSSLCAGKLFRVGLFAADNRHSQLLLTEVSIDIQDALGFRDCILSGFVHGVAFLPEEFAGTQERTGGFFPTNDAAPLVVQLWQVTVGFDDVFVVVAE